MTAIPQIAKTRGPVGDDDVQIDILFCGVCHSDLHYARSEWMPVTYPQVVGHEIVGKVVKVGRNVTKHKAGDLVGVGCIECRAPTWASKSKPANPRRVDAPPSS